TVPGAFAPVEIDGRLLVDGGLSENLPVEVVRSMGADVVIAVDVGTPLAPGESIQSFLAVTNQAFTFLTRPNAERSARLANVVLRPDLEGVSSGGFAQALDAIPKGEAAVESARSALEPLAMDEESWAARRRPLEARESSLGPLAFVRVEGNERV